MDCSKLTLTLALGSAMAFVPATASAANIFIVSDDGIGSAEAENFSARSGATVDDQFVQWETMTSPASGSFSGATGGEYMQVPGTTPYSGGQNFSEDLPYIDYVFRVGESVDMTGDWEIELRGAGETSGDDSVHMRLIGPNGMDFTTTNVDVGVTGAAWTWSDADTADELGPGDIVAGDYTVRLYMREDGVAIDKVVFYRDDAWPTLTDGQGPPESTIVPEPASLALLGLGGVMMLRRGRRA